MRVPFKIFPSFGFKNSQFQVVTAVPEIVIQIKCPDGQLLTVSPSREQPATLTKLTEPGAYQAQATVNGELHEQHFQVLDGIRIGSSELKQAYVFNGMPYAFLLMRDRMHIHHDPTNSLWEESLSPSAIVQLDAKTLLFKTELGADPKTKLNLTNLGIYSLDSLSVVAELLDHYALIWLDTPHQRIWLYSLAEHRILCLSTKATNGIYWQELLSVSSKPGWKLQAGNAQLFTETAATINIINTEKLQVVSIPQQPDLAINETGVCYRLIGRTIHLINFADLSLEKPLFEVPATATLQTQGFYYVGANLKLSAGPTEFDRQFSEAAATLSLRPGQKAMLPEPVVCGHEPTTCLILSAPHGFYVLRNDQQHTLIGVWYAHPRAENLERFEPIRTSVTVSCLTYCGAIGEPITLIASSPEPIIIPKHFRGTLVAKNGTRISLMREDQLPITLEPQTKEYQILSTDNNQHYLLAYHHDKFDLFNLSSIPTKCLEAVALVDKAKYPLADSILWYYAEPNQPAGYNLATNSKVPFSTHGTRQSLLAQASTIKLSLTHATIISLEVNESVLVPAHILVTLYGTVRASVPGDLVAASPNLTKVICRRGQELYVMNYQQHVRNYTSQTVALPLPDYQESYLSPDGKFLMLKDRTQQYLLYNIATGEISTYLSGKFLAFDKSGSLIFEGKSTRSARLLDPVTFDDITPLSYHHYRFLSPDGKLFAQTIAETKYHAGVFNGYITRANINWLESILDHGLTPEDQTEEKINQVQQTRQEFYDKHEAYFVSKGIEVANQLRSHCVYEVHNRLQIGIVGTTSVTEVSLPANMNFFNYAAFSFDSGWIAVVGKAPGCGFVTVAKLAFDYLAQTLAVTNHFQSNDPDTATWVCGISKTNQFATYTSNGNTYILEIGDDLLNFQPTGQAIQAEFVRRPNTVCASSGVWNRIEGKNFLCYSPTGRFMALSEQRYDPISLSGTGHQASNAVHVIDAREYTLVDSFHSHGAMIKDDKTKKVVFAAFSEDEQNLMTMSTDGVVIVRRIVDLA